MSERNGEEFNQVANILWPGLSGALKWKHGLKGIETFQLMALRGPVTLTTLLKTESSALVSIHHLCKEKWYFAFTLFSLGYVLWSDEGQRAEGPCSEDWYSLAKWISPLTVSIPWRILHREYLSHSLLPIAKKDFSTEQKTPMQEMHCL